MTPKRTYIPAAVSALLLLWMISCAGIGPDTSGANGSEAQNAVQQRLIPLVEALYLNAKELKEVYRDVRSFATGHALYGDDDQLNHTQKTAMYVQKSLISAEHQWEMLSMMEDIRPEAIIDYYTLRHKGIGNAMREATYDSRFITIYRTRVTNVEAQSVIDRALKLIEANRHLFEQMLDTMGPLVRKGDGRAM